MCFAPFSQLLVQPTGKISPCCYHFGIDLGSSNQDLMSEVWNGDKIQKLRTEFLAGNIRKCKSRIHNINCNRKFDRFRDSVWLSVEQEAPPIRLDLRLNGQCNLSCVMCDVWEQPNGINGDESIVWKNAESEIFPYLKEVDLLGGEPFVQKDTFRLIDAVLEVNPNCQWSFVTNGQYNAEPKITNLLRRIRVRQLQVSVDSLDHDTFSRIRKKGDLDRTLKTISQFSQLNREKALAGEGFELVLSMCVLQQNWKEIPQFLAFCKGLSARPDFQFAFYDPSGESSLKFLSKLRQKEIAVELKMSVEPLDLKQISTILTPLGLSLDF